MEAALEILLGYVKPFIEQNPKLSAIAIVLYFVGLFLKPTLAFLKEIVNITPSQSDNLLLDKILSNKVYKAIAYALDWFARIKLPVKK